MKKLLSAVVAVLAFANFTNAQIKKGAIFFGGDISAATQTTKSPNQTSTKQNGVTISPVFGKAIKDNLILGVSAGVGLYNYNYDNNNKSKETTYNAGVFARRYKNIGNSGFYLFVQGGLNSSYSKQTQQYTTTSPYTQETRRFTIGLNAYPGISYAVSKKMHLETGFNNLLALSYLNEKRKVGTTDYNTNGFSISSSLSNATSSLYLGFRLLLNK